MLNGNLFYSSSPEPENGHKVFVRSCLINKETQLSKSLRHVTPSASSYWSILYHGMFKEHKHPFKTSKCCTALWYVILKGGQNLLSLCCFIFTKPSFIILMAWHNHLRVKPLKTFVIAFLFYSSLVEPLLSSLQEQLGPLASNHGPNITA